MFDTVAYYWLFIIEFWNQKEKFVRLFNLISPATFHISSCASFPTGMLTRPLHRVCQLRTNYKINSCVCPSGASVFPATIHCALIANYHGRRAPLATEESTGPRAVTSFRRQVPVDATEPITEQFIYSFPVISSSHSTLVLSFIVVAHPDTAKYTDYTNGDSGSRHASCYYHRNGNSTAHG